MIDSKFGDDYLRSFVEEIIAAVRAKHDISCQISAVKNFYAIFVIEFSASVLCLSQTTT